MSQRKRDILQNLAAMADNVPLGGHVAWLNEQRRQRGMFRDDRDEVLDAIAERVAAGATVTTAINAELLALGDAS